MRMDRLLADLEAASAAQARAEARAEVAESVRAEVGRITVADRLRAVRGQEVGVTVADSVITGTLLELGEGWLAVDRRMRGMQSCGVESLVRPGVTVVPTAAVVAVVGAGRAHVTQTESAVGRTWGSLLRAVARSRVPVAWHAARGVEPYVGLVDAVGADHVMLRMGRDAAHSVALATGALAWLDLCAPRDS